MGLYTTSFLWINSIFKPIKQTRGFVIFTCFLSSVMLCYRKTTRPESHRMYNLFFLFNWIWSWKRLFTILFLVHVLQHLHNASTLRLRIAEVRLAKILSLLLSQQTNSHKLSLKVLYLEQNQSQEVLWLFSSGCFISQIRMDISR